MSHAVVHADRPLIRHPALRVTAIASGSSNNAFLVQAGATSLLLDVGLPLKSLRSRLMARGVALADLSAVLLTHEHADHSSGAGAVARRVGIPVVANSGTLNALAERDELPFERQELPTGQELRHQGVTIRSVPVPHDAAEPVGFVIEYCGASVCYLTDVGSVTGAMCEALHGVSLAIVEANHDLGWLLRGPYPLEMKRRVASDRGHLSNAACAEMLAARLETGGPLCVWLAHLSGVNNSPTLARRSVSEAIQKRTTVPFTLDIALRDHLSVSWQAGAQAVQLGLL